MNSLIAYQIHTWTRGFVCVTEIAIAAYVTWKPIRKCPRCTTLYKWYRAGRINTRKCEPKQIAKHFFGWIWFAIRNNVLLNVPNKSRLKVFQYISSSFPFFTIYKVQNQFGVRMMFLEMTAFWRPERQGWCTWKCWWNVYSFC